MAWLKEILEENRRTVETWPGWKRRAEMSGFVDKKSYDQLMDDRNQRIDENTQLKAEVHQLKAELAQCQQERDSWRAIVETDCESDEEFRAIAKWYDHSDSYGIESHAVILQRVLDELAGMGEEGEYGTLRWYGRGARERKNCST